MKSNWIKYVFIIFIIVILIFVVFKIKQDEQEKQQELEYVSSQQEKITELNKLTICGKVSFSQKWAFKLIRSLFSMPKPSPF